MVTNAHKELQTILSKYETDPTSLSSKDVETLLQGMRDAPVTFIDLTLAEPRLAAKQKEAAEGLTKIRDGIEKLTALRNYVDEYIDSSELLTEASHKLARAQTALMEGRKKLRQGEQTLTEGKQALASSRQELSESETTLRDGEAELAEGVIYEEGSPTQVFDTPGRERTRAFVKRLKTYTFETRSKDFDFLRLKRFTRLYNPNDIKCTSNRIAVPNADAASLRHFSGKTACYTTL